MVLSAKLTHVTYQQNTHYFQAFNQVHNILSHNIYHIFERI